MAKQVFSKCQIQLDVWTYLKTHKRNLKISSWGDYQGIYLGRRVLKNTNLREWRELVECISNEGITSELYYLSSGAYLPTSTQMPISLSFLGFGSFRTLPAVGGECYLWGCLAVLEWVHGHSNRECACLSLLSMPLCVAAVTFISLALVLACPVFYCMCFVHCHNSNIHNEWGGGGANRGLWSWWGFSVLRGLGSLFLVRDALGIEWWW